MSSEIITINQSGFSIEKRKTLINKESNYRGIYDK